MTLTEKDMILAVVGLIVDVRGFVTFARSFATILLATLTCLFTGFVFNAKRSTVSHVLVAPVPCFGFSKEKTVIDA
jgi:hypothetical protein